MQQPVTYLITNSAVVFGILAVILGLIFYTHKSDNVYCRRFYKFVPALLLCYFIPSLLHTFHIVPYDYSCTDILSGAVDAGKGVLEQCQLAKSPEDAKIAASGSQLYYVASRFLLPTSLVLLTLSIDFKKIKALGPKAIILFLTGTLGIVIGGPIALLIMSLINPDIVAGDVWRGMTTVAGSWIGGGANQAAMKEVYDVSGELFSSMIAVDVIIANIWMAVLLLMAGRAKQIDTASGADTSAIEDLKATVERFQKKHARIPDLTDLMLILAIGFGATAVGHLVADNVAPFIAENWPAASKYSLTSKFFWLVVTATSIGLVLSTTKLKQFEAAGASRVGSVFIYVLVASIGLHMDISAIVERPWLFLVGGIWMLVHASLMLIVAKAIKAPLFYMAVGSQANVGGAASAPVVASAFHPSLAPVGVLLAVLGYALGTYAAWFCGQILMVAAGA
ncbi:DUF819 domain-containing protein [Aliikangiella coralliicola]|uniref:DUF819 family protein n=1 Tax=Aliikangiella coralliicola TaxID=2592383 RepID=A0A545UJZ2_9GAMM|nr:DUF819 family protein [Aliikangiella coralliicola]TQV89776.1 DUF819 family protein [Aliikangiella coralliicola]